MSLTAIFQRLDGSRVTRTIQFAKATDEIVLLPMRSLVTGDVEETRRYDRTTAIQDDLPVFRQNADHDPRAGLEFFSGRN